MSILDRRRPAATKSLGRLLRGALVLCIPALAAVCVAPMIGVAAQAPRLVAGEHADPPPGELADPISALVANGGQRVRIGRTTLEFWWVKTLPLTEDSRGLSWSGLAEGTLVGAVTLSSPYPDAHGQMVPTGSYTLRYVTESPTNALLLAPVADDDKTDPTGRDDAVALARQTPGASTAPEWRIDPAAPGSGPPSVSTLPATLNVTLPASREGMDVGVLTFDLVLVGAIRP